MVKAKWDAAHRAARSKLRVDLQISINAFERWVAARFVEIKIPNLWYMREEVDIM